MLKRLLPNIPAAHKERFGRTLESISRTYLILASVVLCASFLTETFALMAAGRPKLSVLAGSLCVFTVGLLIVLLTGRWRPKRNGLWCMLLAFTPYFLIILGAQDDNYNASRHLTMALVGLCFFLPIARWCLLGAAVFGATLLVILYREFSGDLMQVMSYSLPAFLLSLFGFLGQQSGIRYSFLKQLETEEVYGELQLSKLALDHSTHYVVWLNREGQLLYGNEAFCSSLGYTAQDLATLEVSQLSRELAEQEWAKLVAELSSHGSALRPLQLSAKNGEERFVEIQFDLVESSIRQIICGVATDLTERQRLDEEIRRVQKLEGLDTLAGGLAHDYNNLLVPIVTNASLVLQDLDDDHVARPAILDIISAGERAASLTEQLIAYTGVSDLEPTPLSLIAELDAVTKILRSSLPKGAKLTIDKEADAPLILGEPAQIHQVLLNLVLNAGQAVDQVEGVINIHVGQRELSSVEASRLNPPTSRPAGTYVTCLIRDNGCGMSAEIRSRMFNPFFTTKENGHGLGLSAVLGIMRNHSGGILVESAPNEGTSITLFLPAYFGEIIDREEPMKDLPKESQGDHVVMFVDDEPLIRNVGQMVLTAHGYEVLLAGSGDEAIQLFERHSDSVDVVVLDNRMPGPCITETVSALRRQQPGIPIIASSGYPSEIPAALRVGPECVSILPKPYRASDLTDAVGDALAGQPEDA